MLIRGNPKLLKQLEVYQPTIQVDDFLVAPVHMLSDQTELLRKNNYSAEQCTYCDFWWVYDNHFILVQSTSLRDIHSFRIGASYANYIEGDVLNERIHLGTEINPLTTLTIANMVRNLVNWFDTHEEEFEAHSTEILAWNESPNWLNITNQDFGKIH